MDALGTPLGRGGGGAGRRGGGQLRPCHTPAAEERTIHCPVCAWRTFFAASNDAVDSCLWHGLHFLAPTAKLSLWLCLTPASPSHDHPTIPPSALPAAAPCGPGAGGTGSGGGGTNCWYHKRARVATWPDRDMSCKFSPGSCRCASHPTKPSPGPIFRSPFLGGWHGGEGVVAAPPDLT